MPRARDSFSRCHRARLAPPALSSCIEHSVCAVNVWPDSLATYTSTMANISDILLASGAKHVLYALGTPFEADALPSCGPYCNAPNTTLEGAALSPLPEWPQPTDGGNGRCGPPACVAGGLGCGVPNETAKASSPDPGAPGCGPPTNAVDVLNKAAMGVMAARNIPIVDLNSVVHAHCGAAYASCDLCDNETQYMGIECGYHYSPKGVGILAQAVADAFTAVLGSTAQP